MPFYFILLLVYSLITNAVFAVAPSPAFHILPLGVSGGINEGNLSAYLLSDGHTKDFILLDAGTLVNGLMKSSTQKSLKKLGFLNADSSLHFISNILHHHIKAYLISHAHLDHIEGLVIASPDDSKKRIFGTDISLKNLKDFIFNWQIWPNFGNQGITPHLNQYEYIDLPFNQFIAIPETHLNVAAFPLSHGQPNGSTAFLIQSKPSHCKVLPTDMQPRKHQNYKNNRLLSKHSVVSEVGGSSKPKNRGYNSILENSSFELTNKFTSTLEFRKRSNPSAKDTECKQEAYILYVGDTGADQIEKSNHLQHLWRKIAPLIRMNQLKAMLIETSFPDSQPNHQLFGHLTPKLLFSELQELAILVNPKQPQTALMGLPIFITHIKPSFSNIHTQEIIEKELKIHNHLGVKVIILKQGELQSVF